MPLTGQDTWAILEDYVYNLILAQTAAGGNPTGKLAVQPNPDGSTGIQLVSQVTPPEEMVFPSIGVQCYEYDENPAAISTHDMIGRFSIGISVKVSQDPTVPDTGRAALQYLRNYQNDASGNGLSPLLREDVTLGGLCQWSGIVKMERTIWRSEAESADAIALAVYTFETHDRIRL